MSTTTDKLALFKYDPSTDGAQTFNIQKALNENWDKLDDAVKEILITLANKAPNGYGLGGDCWDSRTTAIADLNEAVYRGWYQIAPNALNTPPAFSNDYPDAGMLLVSVGGYTIYQRYLSYAPRGVPFYREAIRYARVSGGVYKFTDWEYVNPLLNRGFEYRTTERYQGRPVYVKVVDCGNLPNTTSKRVAHGIANVAYMIDVTLQGTNTSTFTHNANELTVWANYDEVYIKTLNDLSGYSVYAILRYTKTTD